MKIKIVKFYILLVLILVFTFPAYYFISPSFSDINRIKPSTYSGEYVFIKSTDDTELFIRKHFSSSSVPTLIFLPDGPGKVDVAFEILLADSLYKYANLAFPDYRGTGKSGRSKSTTFYALQNYINDLDAIISSINSENIILVSHGFGTVVAQSFMSQNPSKVYKNILISPQINYQKSAKLAAKALADKYEVPDAPKQVPLYFEMHGYAVDEEDVGFFGTSKILSLMDFYKLNFTDTLNFKYIDYNFIINQNIYSKEEVFAITFPSLTIGLTYSLYKTDLAPLYHSISNNTFVVFGENDKMNNKEFFLNKMNQTEIKSIPNSGFYPFIDNPKSFLTTIIEIINET